MTDISLDTALSAVIGGRTAGAIARAFGYTTVGEFVGHYPRRYASRGELTALDTLPLGENVTIVAEVREVRERPMRNRRGGILEVSITDGRGILTLTFFNQSWRAKELVVGSRGIFAGKVGAYRGTYQLAHPDYELFEEGSAENSGDRPAPHADSARRWAETPIPIYPATATVASWQIQRSMDIVLDSLGTIPDPVPVEVRQQEGLIDADQAVRQIHRPTREVDWQDAREALRFQEAFLLQTALLQQRAESLRQPATPRPVRAGGLLDRFDRDLSFTLTGDQSAVGDEIAADLSRSHPMSRLVQGEVGSGKTLVALRAMLQVADSGGQAALLAPTEVLAAQHLRSIVRTLGPDLAAELAPTLVTGQQPAAIRKRSLLSVAAGGTRIVVGTHALMSASVQFADLGLVVVDEQHRFGVEQREALRLKAHTPPHTLVLTATPIPRTVAMTVFGDLDVSTIRELPAGRAGITSHVVPLADHPRWSHRIWQRVSEELAQGRQAFVVCPAIRDAPAGEDVLEAGEMLAEEVEQLRADAATGPVEPLASVETTVAMLRAHPLFSSTAVAALHGQMSSDEKDQVMSDFMAEKIRVLVATTVIEVGVDVPNASTMVVLNADRFGVSQLHQLRGRVGRGGVAGLCLFVTTAPAGTIARERVAAVAATLDGFELAQVDLELRQEGDVLGTTQAGGRSSLRILRVARDGDIITRARELASGILDADGDLTQHPVLRAALTYRLDAAEREFLAKS
ncbi:ATP-dependent DNA helicase RecG [Klugiella xanthotipulae]|uniref:ATP-dependent DNA helicase RecG n=1 Tax=Klugiella xanthotipulae TaxID=244735 RepID=UPI0011510D4C|nr:ATP-dependent DNA helicase RecG [Klugiella xanthotipulae]